MWELHWFKRITCIIYLYIFLSIYLGVVLLFWGVFSQSILYILYVERVAERLRGRTQDLEVWGSIPASPVMCKSLGQALNSHCLWPPSSNGYSGHISKVGSTCAGCALVAESYRGRKRVGWICMHRYQTIKSVPLPYNKERKINP